METTQTLLTKEKITAHIEHNNLCHHERITLSEILSAIEADDIDQLIWFSQFGDRIRAILLNSHAYKKGAQFGFTEIDFDEYGWFKRPTFLELEDLYFGITDKDRYGNYSTITLGRGINHVWTYGLSCSFGTAGSCSGISVYNPAFPSKEDALQHAISKLKNMMLPKVGDSDTTNYNQKVILATLKDITKYEVGRVQLSLF